MSEKTDQKLVKCGCGGEARIGKIYGDAWTVECTECGIQSGCYDTEAEAVEAWNLAMSGSAEEKLKAFWDGMSAEMKEKRTAKVMNDGINYCENCEGYVEAPMAYCPYCGARLEWK